MFGEEAVVQIGIGAVATESFRARGGEIRLTTVQARSVSGPLTLRLKVDSHERRNLGLRLDRLTVSSMAGSAFRLSRRAAMRPLVAICSLLASLLLLGASPTVAGGLAFAASIVFWLAARADLFAAWRQTYWLVPTIAAATLAFLLARRFMEHRLNLEPSASRTLVIASLVVMVSRLVLVNHPDFYYPDLLTHARLVDSIRSQGPSFFLHPADALGGQGAWTKPVLGGVSALPYAVGFHTSFAILAAVFGWSVDQIEGALKAGASFISVLPILLAGVLASRLSLPPLGALMLAVVPTYTSRLSFGLLPALTGHVLDLVVLLILVLVVKAGEIVDLRSAAVLALALVCGHLTYTSSVVNEGVFVMCLSLVWLSRRLTTSALRLAGAEFMAALVAFGLYYRHFAGDVLGTAGRLLDRAAFGSAPTAYPIESFWALLLERTSSFFGWPYLALVFLGLIAYPAARRSAVTQAWALSYLALIFLRAKIPDIFRYGHETLFITPLVALLAGSAIAFGVSQAGGREWPPGRPRPGSWFGRFGTNGSRSATSSGTLCDRRDRTLPLVAA